MERFKDGRSERFLSAAELARLGEAIAKAEADGSNRKGLGIGRASVYRALETAYHRAPARGG